MILRRICYTFTFKIICISVLLQAVTRNLATNLQFHLEVYVYFQSKMHRNYL